jgi:protein-disulfide isomerase
MSISKREEIKAQRLRRKRQQRMNMFLIIGGTVLILAALFISPYIVNAMRPVGAINQITEVARPYQDGRAIGNANAPVVIEVFTDFQCPSCKQYSETIEMSLINSEYVANGQVYYIFRQFPFIDRSSITKESHQAANASMCANEQGEFWSYHDMLFANWNGENDGAFNDKRLVAFAETLGLNMDQFNACFKDNAYEAEITSDYDLGLGYGVSGTPTIFVNGQVVRPGYVPTYEELVQEIDAALAEGG